MGDGVPPSPAALRRGKFNAPKKADREHRCFTADHRAYSGVLGDSIGSGRLVGISALAELRSSLCEDRELRLAAHFGIPTRHGVEAAFGENRLQYAHRASAYDRQIARFWSRLL